MLADLTVVTVSGLGDKTVEAEGREEKGRASQLEKR